MGKNESKKNRKIFSISMVKNEADIIESFVRYHQHIFDGMVFLDNMSSDRTPEILEKLREEGLPIYISYDVDHEYAQRKKTTELMRRTFQQFHPDIILPLDADEFLVATNNTDHPRDILNKINLQQLHHIMWRTYVLNEGENKNELFIPKRITYARKDNHENRHKVVVPYLFANNFRGTLTTGNHNFLIGRKKEKVKVNMIEELKLAHFPIRSLEQFKSKMLIAWINRLARKDANELYLKRFVQAIKEGRSKTEHDLIQLAKHFPFRTDIENVKIVNKPINLSDCKSIDLKYTNANEVDSFFNLLENSEELAKKFALLKRNE
ncbi:glycosyltransferase family 2 protein [Cytobacillus firmus]|uniref:glycosyltransferase family 2 protein n=2 Tax=Cytobacillus firmus TaxID=1399 RepID=UPI001CFD0F02|nr:glycosyltransferase family 2 protein [Cytobacillus firmus]URT73180.1 glycosyltransferase family 2 protein [Cytobacillus firmus]WHY64169.1 glycosyltransferase family 2 protein [Cytobacillus firmus]